MSIYKQYKEINPSKTDEQIIESLAMELTDKVEVIHRLLNEINELKQNYAAGFPFADEFHEWIEKYEFKFVEVPIHKGTKYAWRNQLTSSSFTTKQLYDVFIISKNKQ